MATAQGGRAWSVPTSCVRSRPPSGSVPQMTKATLLLDWLLPKLKTWQLKWPSTRHLIENEVLSSVTLCLIPAILKMLIINSSSPSFPPLTHNGQRRVNVCLNYPHNRLILSTCLGMFWKHTYQLLPGSSGFPPYLFVLSFFFFINYHFLRV